ncbi:hypothetical protein OIE68_45135 [Nocardia vinacea]|uniref:hypothetical protein n=1 Tax=Nocardia vinacea TaxID=96468 RepID=UPI002E0E2214|nr:hypothetical protein OIE68_45135 [Nocardia vinacea]
MNREELERESTFWNDALRSAGLDNISVKLDTVGYLDGHIPNLTTPQLRQQMAAAEQFERDYPLLSYGRSRYGRAVHGLVRDYQDAINLELARRDRHEQMQKIAAVAETVEDAGVRDKLSELVSKLDEQQQRIDELARDGEGGKAAMSRLEYRKELWRMRKSMLDREPAAVLLGGLLLVVFGGTLIAAMFLHTEISQIISSAFLMILGFFFGQTSSRRSQDDG